ncbi:MAG: MFS transporter [Bdellovibrionota bacterium]
MQKIEWQPENLEFWKSYGRVKAIKNLCVSSLVLTVAFMVWIHWSALTVYIAIDRPDFSPSILYLLTSLPLLSAAFLRVPYSFMVNLVGGRRLNLLITAVLFVPLLINYYCLEAKPHWLFYFVAAFCTGLAGANFASNTSYISYFFPYRFKSIALGINSAIGNLGVGIGQWFLPVVIIFAADHALTPLRKVQSSEGMFSLSAAPISLAILCLLALLIIWFFMDDIKLERMSWSSQVKVATEKESWYLSALYTATFGAYIGFASAFPYLMSRFFDSQGVVKYAFWGAVISALMRPLGHLLAKFIGAVSATIFSFSLLIVGCVGLFLILDNLVAENKLQLFLLFYVILFIGTGLGNGSTTALVPEIYFLRHLKVSSSRAAQVKASQETAIVVAFSSAIATFGSFLLPLSFNLFRLLLGTEIYAFIFFALCFFCCLLFTVIRYFLKTDSNPLCLVVDGKRLIFDRPNRMNQLMDRS